MKKICFYYYAPSGFIPHDENAIRKIYSDKELTKETGLIQIVSIVNKIEQMSTNTATVFLDKHPELHKLIYTYVRDKKAPIKTKSLFSECINVKKVKRVLITDNIRKVTLYI